MGSSPQLRDHELPEYTYRGPFGGYQSEMPVDSIENLGFAQVNNILFRKGVAQSRPPVNPLPPIPPFDPWYGVFDFFDIRGGRHQIALTATKVYVWQNLSGTFVELPGDGLSGLVNLFTGAVVGGFLYFCQGGDLIKVWDGFQVGYTVAGSVNFSTKFLMEFDNRLIAAFTYEGGPPRLAAPQRLRWSAPGQGSDFSTAFLTGQTDLFNDLGPITGLVKLGQAAYIFQQWGIVQMQLTGNGLQPFQFFPLTSHSKGCIAPYSLASFGENMCCYVGKDNIYQFDGSTSYPIGDTPIDSKGSRVGARTAIFADLITSDLNKVFGYYSTSLNGVDFNAYWLFIPGAGTWIYHVDENNWTRLSWSATPTVAGTFNRADELLINELVGSIGAQGWSPASLTTTNPLDQMFIGFDDGSSGTIDFTGVCEQEYSLVSGQCSFGDLRHLKALTRFRLTFRDLMALDYTVLITNERGESVTQTKRLGTGTGRILTYTFDLKIAGQYLTWKVSCPANTQTQFVEFKPIYSQAGEVKG